MIDTNEALARIAVADFEARRFKERSEKHARRWRVAITISRAVFVLGFGIYLQTTHWQISGAQVCGLFLIYLASSAWEEHRSREMIRTLQADLERLKDEIKEKSA